MAAFVIARDLPSCDDAEQEANKTTRISGSMADLARTNTPDSHADHWMNKRAEVDSGLTPS